ncbi:MAG: electron transfer flavoprotein subunit alpha/FixB family protein, partial [Gemmatimonadetes bacterium]|nr:electron transfer flavoprotein subunit alpha/FixB family protein [Gemmatimonadota bacterium]
MPSVLVAGEVENGALAPVTGELLAAARKVTAGERPMLALLAAQASGLGGAGLAAGVARVYLLEHASLDHGGAGVFDAPVAALEKLIRATEPEIVLFGRTDFGANVAPRVAVRLGVSVASDCIGLAVDPASRRLTVTRPVYGGNVLAGFEFGPRNPQIAVLRPKVFDPGEPAPAAHGEVVAFDVSDAVEEPVARLVETVPEEPAGVRLEDAEVVVAGGR